MKAYLRWLSEDEAGSGVSEPVGKGVLQAPKDRDSNNSDEVRTTLTAPAVTNPFDGRFTQRGGVQPRTKTPSVWDRTIGGNYVNNVDAP